MAIIESGKNAPAFTLMNQNGEKIKLSDYKGQWVVVYFYPKAMTPGCTVQACGITSAEAQYAKAGVTVMALRVRLNDKRCGKLAPSAGKRITSDGARKNRLLSETQILSVCWLIPSP